jgi:hypothetical protein
MCCDAFAFNAAVQVVLEVRSVGSDQVSGRAWTKQNRQGFTTHSAVLVRAARGASQLQDVSGSLTKIDVVCPRHPHATQYGCLLAWQQHNSTIIGCYRIMRPIHDMNYLEGRLLPCFSKFSDH